MARRYGNNVSSLVSAARAAAERQASLQDQIQAYTYDLSMKNLDDYQKYAGYLADRVKQYEGSDPSKALSLQKTMTSANRTYTSNEIGRQSLGVLYGQQSNTDKYQKMYGLMQRAMENGDMSLAQNLENQLARLDVTIQNENMARAGSASASASAEQTAIKKGIDAQIGKIDEGVQSLKYNLKQGLVDTGEYTQQLTALLSAKAQTYRAAVGGQLGLDASNMAGYQKDLDKLTANPDFMKYGTNIDNITNYDARTIARDKNVVGVSPEGDLKDTPIAGYYQAFTKDKNDNYGGDFQPVPFKPGTDQSAYEKGFKGLGFNSGVKDGGINMDLVDPFNGDLIRGGRVVLDDVNNPRGAVFIRNGVKYLVQPNGTMQPLMDTASGALLPDGIGQDKSKKSDLETGFNKALKATGGALTSLFDKKRTTDIATNIENQKKAALDMANRARQMGYNDIADNIMSGVNNIGKTGWMNSLPIFNNMATKALENKMNEMNAQIASRQQDEAIRRQLEADRIFKASLPKLPPGVKPGPGPTNPPSVVWKTPTTPYSSNPDQRAVQVIQDALAGKFNNSQYNRFYPSPGSASYFLPR